MQSIKFLGEVYYWIESFVSYKNFRKFSLVVCFFWGFCVLYGLQCLSVNFVFEIFSIIIVQGFWCQCGFLESRRSCWLENGIYGVRCILKKIGRKGFGVGYYLFVFGFSRFLGKLVVFCVRKQKRCDRMYFIVVGCDLRGRKGFEGGFQLVVFGIDKILVMQVDLWNRKWRVGDRMQFIIVGCVLRRFFIF